MIVGQIEAVEDDSVVLQVGEGIVLLEVEGDGPASQIGIEVRVRPMSVEIYPAGV